MPRAEAHQRVLVAGGTGCVGTALVRALIEQPRFRVRVMSRRASAAQAPRCEVVNGSVLDADAVRAALSGVDVAYYLVHALDEPNYQEREYAAARAFAAAAGACRRIVFLGALGDEEDNLSPHIRSRHAVGRLLQNGTAPVVELRASVVLGAGSAVFQLIRELAERIPVLVVPKGADKRCQPIALEDVVRWLVSAAEQPDMVGAPLEIGGPETVTYAELMQLYVRLRGLSRPILRMPIATPRLSGWWIGAFSCVPPRVGRELVLGLQHDAVVRDSRAQAVAGFDPLNVREAMRRAIDASQRSQPSC